MQRNRALLFAINLIAALVIVLVYLEHFSVDKGQIEGHLIAYKSRCKELRMTMQERRQWNYLWWEEKAQFDDCANLNEISRIAIAGSSDEAQLLAMSKSLARLHKIQNDLNATGLGNAYVTPLGVGLTVPLNDMYILFGVLLVTLYIWLAFSFKQHARVIQKINKVFTEQGSEGEETKATISELVGLNFLFRTSKDEGMVLVLFVKTLYWLAPLSMTIACLNNSLPDTSEGFRAYFNSLVRVPLLFQWVLTIVLWIIGHNVNESDKLANIEPTDPAINQDGLIRRTIRRIKKVLRRCKVFLPPKLKRILRVIKRILTGRGR